jgi:hypothetical protein
MNGNNQNQKTISENMQEPPQERKLSYTPGTANTYPIAAVQSLMSIFSGKPYNKVPKRIYLPDPATGENRGICLSRSNSYPIYYRTTPTSCACAGWYWSTYRYSVGKCRHHTEAYPEQAKYNAAQIDLIKSQKAEEKAPSAHQKGKPMRLSEKEAVQAVEIALQEANLSVSSVRAKADDFIEVRIPFVDPEKLTPEQDRDMDRIRDIASAAAPGFLVSLRAF